MVCLPKWSAPETTDDRRRSSVTLLGGEERVLDGPIRSKLGKLATKSTQQIRGSYAPLVAQHQRELQRVDCRLPANVIIGEDKSVSRVLLQLFNARLPLQQFLATKARMLSRKCAAVAFVTRPNSRCQS